MLKIVPINISQTVFCVNYLEWQKSASFDVIKGSKPRNRLGVYYRILYRNIYKLYILYYPTSSLPIQNPSKMLC